MKQHPPPPPPPTRKPKQGNEGPPPLPPMGKPKSTVGVTKSAPPPPPSPKPQISAAVKEQKHSWWQTPYIISRRDLYLERFVPFVLFALMIASIPFVGNLHAEKESLRLELKKAQEKAGSKKPLTNTDATIQDLCVELNDKKKQLSDLEHDFQVISKKNDEFRKGLIEAERHIQALQDWAEDAEAQARKAGLALKELPIVKNDE